MAFRLFKPPKDRRLNLGLENVMAFFRAVKLNLSRDAAKLIILRYDDDRDGLLTFTNVRNIFKPRETHLSNEFKSRLPD